MYAQITAISKLKDQEYPNHKFKPIPFMKRILESKGVVVNNILTDSTLLEKFGGRDENRVLFEKDIEQIKKKQN